MDKELKGKSFRWRIGGIGWAEEQPGLVCVVGSCYAGGQPLLYLLAEAESSDTKELCRSVLEFDHRFGPEFWYCDKKNDAALRILRQMNEEVKTVLAGKKYEVANAPWHRRDITTSHSPIFEMSNGLDYILTVLNDLLPEKNPRLFLPKNSKCLAQLRPVERLEKTTFADVPAVTALGVAVVELLTLADNERRQSNAPRANSQDYDRLRIGLKG